MQIKSNKEARNYQEQVYFGLTVRQLVFSGLAGAAALGVFFLAQGRLSMEVVSWLCIVVAAPFAAFGFIRWHGMYMEEIIQVLIRSRIILGKTVYFKPDNRYKAFTIDYLKEKEGEDINAAKRKKSEKEAS